MDSAEVVMNEVQSAREAMILDLFREGVCEACKPPHLHTHREILALSMACADFAFRDLPANDRTLCANALAGAIFALQRVFSVNLAEHPEVDLLQMECGFNGYEVSAVSVC